MPTPQVPSHVVTAIFPPPPEPVTLATSLPDSTGSSDSGDDGGMGQGLSIAPSSPQAAPR